MLGKSFAHFGIRIFEVSENEGLALACLNTGRNLPDREPFLTEAAFFDNTTFPGGKSSIQFRLDIIARVPEIKAPSSVRTTGHAVPAPDATMEVHHRDPVGPLECGLGRADTRAGSIGAVVAKQHEGLLAHVFRLVTAFVAGEYVLYFSDQSLLISSFWVPISGTL